MKNEIKGSVKRYQFGDFVRDFMVLAVMIAFSVWIDRTLGAGISF